MRSSSRPRGKASYCCQYQKHSMEPASKSFRAVLPHLDDAQLEKLQCWIELSCASGLVFREGSHVVLIATRERARTKEAFVRSVRGTIVRLGIALNAGKGRWLALTSEAAVAHEMKERNACARPSVATLPTKNETVGETAEDVGDDNVRLIAIPSLKRRAPARVTKV